MNNVQNELDCQEENGHFHAWVREQALVLAKTKVIFFN